MGYKFEGLEVWQLALEYLDTIYTIAERLPRAEEYNLKSQIVRAATLVRSISLRDLRARQIESRAVSWG